ncbi:carboxypeptidase-like regulatory domain-containing protein [Nonlabens agnitus]|uniref:TonB-dependent receptor plug domain-containing protein n=1 Tax=Nonlabens agnitus TaxID=870484 RepID=A0A2S9WXA0_9FLAO|nr:carboxypeptidase-like regulatory domain-containing protein [Nonlabens agnitus]PRP68102.1 hypothetical protein BST86_13905 [Nonlabens agnitus]
MDTRQIAYISGFDDSLSMDGLKYRNDLNLENSLMAQSGNYQLPTNDFVVEYRLPVQPVYNIDTVPLENHVVEHRLPIEKPLQDVLLDKPLTIKPTYQPLVSHVESPIKQPMMTITAPKIKITGRIVDAFGSPIPKAHIYVDSKTGTVSDNSGRFTLYNVPQDALVEISHIGYTTELRDASSNMGDIVLDVSFEQLEPIELTNEKPVITSSPSKPINWKLYGLIGIGAIAIGLFIYSQPKVKNVSM